MEKVNQHQHTKLFNDILFRLCLVLQIKIISKFFANYQQQQNILKTHEIHFFNHISYFSEL